MSELRCIISTFDDLTSIQLETVFVLNSIHHQTAMFMRILTDSIEMPNIF